MMTGDSMTEIPGQPMAGVDRGLTARVYRARSWLFGLGAVFVGLVVAVLVFWRTFASGLALLPGDAGDSHFILLTLENWYRAAIGESSWTGAPFFAPETDTLGYSDALSLYAVVYVPLRLLGVVDGVAYLVTLMVVVVIGVAAMLWLSRLLRLPVVLGLVGTILICAPNAMLVALNHAQLVAVEFLPVLLLLGVLAWRQDRAVPRVVLWGSAGLLLGLLFFTAFYIAWFGAVELAFATLLAIALRWRTLRGQRRRILLAFPPVVVGAVVGLVPFVIVYGSVLLSAGGAKRGGIQTAFAAAQPYLLKWRDLALHGQGSVAWGWVVGLHPAGRAENTEFAMTPTPVLLIASIVLALLVVRRSRIPLALVISALFWLGTTFSVAGFTLWRYVIHIVPGATALRAVGRVGLVSSLLLAAAIVVALAILMPVWRRSWRRVVVPLLCAVLVFEQLNLNAPTSFDWRAAETSVAAVPPPPMACRDIYVVGGDASAPFLAQLEAMALSDRFDLPTLNGYSGLAPSGWKLDEPTAPDYLSDVRDWVKLSRLSSAAVCGFDLDTGSWTVGVAEARRTAG